MQLVLDEYLGDTKDPIKLRDGFQDLMGDVLFVIPALQVAKHHRGEFSSVKTELPNAMSNHCIPCWK